MMHLLFSAEFIPASFLLLLILPGDLFRITAETIGLALMAKKRLVVSTGSYILWALSYIGLVAFLLPRFGIVGVAIAYFLSQLFNVVQQVLLSWFFVRYRPDQTTLGAILRGIGMVLAIAITI